MLCLPSVSYSSRERPAGKQMVLTVVVGVTGLHPEPRAPVREGSVRDTLAPGLSPERWPHGEGEGLSRQSSILESTLKLGSRIRSLF